MSEPEFINDVDQGSEQWFELRRGIPTASEFAPILVGGKGRETYANRLAGELLCGAPAEQTFTRPWLERGKEMEGEVRERFARKHLVVLRRPGFVRRKLPSGRYVGCSPDALFDEKGVPAVLEIKTMKPELMVGLRRKDHFNPRILPVEHHAQCLGALWVTGYQRVHLVVWYRGMPFDFHYTVNRTDPKVEETIMRMAKEIEGFDREVNAIVQEAGKW